MARWDTYVWGANWISRLENKKRYENDINNEMEKDANLKDHICMNDICSKTS